MICDFMLNSIFYDLYVNIHTLVFQINNTITLNILIIMIIAYLGILIMIQII